MWATKKAVPSFEKCAELLKIGMTVEEMFGAEVSGATILNLAEHQAARETEASDFESRVRVIVADWMRERFGRAG
jgi:hypothetical protein